MRTNFLNGSRREHMAERRHFSRVVSGSLGLLVILEQLKGLFEVVGTHDRRLQWTNVERRSFCSPVRFRGFFRSNQRLLAWDFLLGAQAAHFAAAGPLDAFIA